MKIVYQNVIWLLMFVAYNYLCLAEDDEFIVGAYFDEENSQAETAFSSQIHTATSMQQMITFTPDIHIVSKTDSFKTSKILCNMTQHKNGVIGIFGPPSPTTASVVESICTNMEVPHIQINWRPSENYLDRYNTIVNFYPRPDLLFHGLAVIVQYLEWRSFVVFYENEEGLVRLQDILKLQSYDPERKVNKIIVKQLGPGPNYRPLLKEVANTTESRFILDCEAENILTILSQAKEIKLLERYHDYFLTSLDAHTVDLDSLNTDANITTIRIIDPENENFERARRNWQLKTPHNLEPYSVKTETALMHDAVKLFSDAVLSLHTTGPIEPKGVNCGNPEEKLEDGLRIASFLKLKADPSGVSGPIRFDDFGRRDDFAIYVVDGHRNDIIGKWTPDNPETLTFLRTANDSYEALIRKMQKGVIIVSSRLGKPYLQKREPRYENENVEGKFEGFSYDLISEIAKKLKFKFEFRLAKDEKYGNFDPKTNSWNGLIKDVLDREADLAICDLTITHERRSVVDFSIPFMRLGISILYKKAEQKDVNMFAFLDPFSTDIWIYTATLYLIISLILYFVSRMAPGDWENPHPCDQNPEELENIWDLKNSLWLTLGSIMTQGCDILPKGLSSRMATSMWWFFSLIMTSSYTANLAAFLTMERLGPQINSAEDLAKQNKIKYGTVQGGATQNFFKNSNYSTYQRMWTSMVQARPSVFEKSNDDGVKRVLTTRQRMYAFLMESLQIEYVIETKCDLKQVGSWLDSKGYGIAMPLDYPYRSAINKAILDLKEHGVITKLKTKWWKERRDQPSCPKQEENKSSKLALGNVGGVFLVLGVGIAIAFVITIYEFLWNVKNVAVDEHISYCEALKLELMFALKVWITKKNTKPKISESISSRSSGIAHSILRGASSFIHLNVLGSKVGTPASGRDE